MAKSKNGVIGALHQQSQTEKPELGPLPREAKGDRPFARKKREGAQHETGERAAIRSSGFDGDSAESSDGVLRYLDPNDIVPWSFKDRSLAEIDDDPEFDELLKRIANAGGNIQPIKVRPIRANNAKFEEVFGFKRLQACKRLGLPVLALIERLSDKEAFRQQSSENSGRSEVAAWSKALSWQNALDKGLVASVDELAVETGRDSRTIQSYLRVVEIMEDDIVQNVKLHKVGIQALFEIRSALLKFRNDPKRKQEFVDRVVEKADAIEDGRGTPKMFANLARAIEPTESAPAKAENTYTSGGAKMFSIKPAKQGYTLKVHFAGSKSLPAEEIEEVLREHLASKGVTFDE